jgi:hypothetical protein
VFVDTNVLVQARFAPAPFHARARRALEAGPRSGAPLRLSRQILREYLAVVTRPQTWAVPLPTIEALADLERLERGHAMLEDGPAGTRGLIASWGPSRSADGRRTTPPSLPPCWRVQPGEARGARVGLVHWRGLRHGVAAADGLPALEP